MDAPSQNGLRSFESIDRNAAGNDLDGSLHSHLLATADSIDVVIDSSKAPLADGIELVTMKTKDQGGVAAPRTRSIMPRVGHDSIVSDEPSWNVHFNASLEAARLSTQRVRKVGIVQRENVDCRSNSRFLDAFRRIVAGSGLPVATDGPSASPAAMGDRMLPQPRGYDRDELA